MASFIKVVKHNGNYTLGFIKEISTGFNSVNNTTYITAYNATTGENLEKKDLYIDVSNNTSITLDNKVIQLTPEIKESIEFGNLQLKALGDVRVQKVLLKDTLENSEYKEYRQYVLDNLQGNKSELHKRIENITFDVDKKLPVLVLSSSTKSVVSVFSSLTFNPLVIYVERDIFSKLSDDDIKDILLTSIHNDLDAVTEKNMGTILYRHWLAITYISVKETAIDLNDELITLKKG